MKVKGNLDELIDELNIISLKKIDQCAGFEDLVIYHIINRWK